MDRPTKASKKALESLEFDLMIANQRLDEAQDEVDDLEEQIEVMRAVLANEDNNEWAIVDIHVTPEMQALAQRARGKQWHEVRDINMEYERIAIENAVYAPIQQGAL